MYDDNQPMQAPSDERLDMMKSFIEAEAEHRALTHRVLEMDERRASLEKQMDDLRQRLRQALGLFTETTVMAEPETVRRW